MSGKSSRTKGFGYEREVVKAFREKGLHAERMWGSNGRTRGLMEEVDVLSGDFAYQCKRIKAMAQYMKPVPGITGQILREDRGESLIVIPLKHYLFLLSLYRNGAGPINPIPMEDDE